MATRSQIIARQIAAYDKIVSDDRTISDVELAIFKIAICQLVDAAFSGGGGSTSAATIQSGVEAAVNINNALTKLTSIDTKTIGQSDIIAAIQSAADIDLIISQLGSIVVNTNNGAPNIIGSYVHSSPSVSDIGGTALAANSSRKSATIVNNSTTDKVNLFFGALGSFGSGLPLLPGQPYQIDNTNLYKGVVRAITSGGITVSLSVMEGV